MQTKYSSQITKLIIKKLVPNKEFAYNFKTNEGTQHSRHRNYGTCFQFRYYIERINLYYKPIHKYKQYAHLSEYYSTLDHGVYWSIY